MSYNNFGRIDIKGNFTNAGTYTDISGTVIFNGSSTQIITGKVSFYDLIINGIGPITTLDSIWVKDALKLISGILNVSSGILTLQNDAVYNGRVVSVGTGNITGTFIAQKWVSRCNALWSSYGSCMGQPINTMNLFTTGFSGCPYFPSYSWVNMYTYLESATGSFTVGYTPPTSTSEVLGRGVGFIYWFQNWGSGPDFPKKLLMQGTLDFQTVFTFPITCTNNSTPANIGWNLVSNPFPGTINWNNSGWTKTAMDNAEYMWNTCSSVYAAYVNGVATNGGSRFIPEGQGFFVHATTPGALLTATSAVIVNNTTQQLLTTSNPDSVNNVLKIGLGEDEIAIRLDSLATNQNDSLFDASEIISDSTRLYSYVYSDTSDIYSINSVKDTNQVIPVNVRKSGTLNFSGVNTFQSQYSIYLKDLLNGSYQQIFNGFTYPYTDTTTSTFQNRFEIHFSKIITTGIKQIVKNNSATINYDLKNIYVNFNFANPQTTQIIIYNLLGQELQRVDGTFYQEKNYTIHRPDVPVIVELLNSNNKVVKKVF
ncbi:MAG TPA: hypothetical protein VNG53_03295 [Bacteroidia bacterium]|nr:hypothetical protein [Bacteroidia bacterium]